MWRLLDQLIQVKSFTDHLHLQIIKINSPNAKDVLRIHQPNGHYTAASILGMQGTDRVDQVGSVCIYIR